MRHRLCQYEGRYATLNKNICHFGTFTKRAFCEKSKGLDQSTETFTNWWNAALWIFLVNVVGDGPAFLFFQDSRLRVFTENHKNNSKKGKIGRKQIAKAKFSKCDGIFNYWNAMFYCCNSRIHGHHQTQTRRKRWKDNQKCRLWKNANKKIIAIDFWELLREHIRIFLQKFWLA